MFFEWCHRKEILQIKYIAYLRRSLEMNIMTSSSINDFIFDVIFEKTNVLWRNKKNRFWLDAAHSARRLIRVWTFCHIIMCIYRKHFSRFQHDLKTQTSYEYKYMETIDKGTPLLIFHWPGFCRWCHKYGWCSPNFTFIKHVANQTLSLKPV